MPLATADPQPSFTTYSYSRTSSDRVQYPYRVPKKMTKKSESRFEQSLALQELATEQRYWARGACGGSVVIVSGVSR